MSPPSTPNARPRLVNLRMGEVRLMTATSITEARPVFAPAEVVGIIMSRDDVAK